jgi:hypothetical protein
LKKPPQTAMVRPTVNTEGADLFAPKSDGK